MGRKTPGASASIPESLKEPKPARRGRTSAFAASDPSIREKLPVEAHLIGGRFRLVRKGAGMEVLDLQTERSVPFPKESTGIVQSVLVGLFEEAAPSAQAGGAKLREVLRDRKLGLVLSRRAVRVDPRHPTQILEEGDDGHGLDLQAYAVSLGGVEMGHVLVAGPARFQLSVPSLQMKITSHTSLDAAYERVRVVAENYLRRQAEAQEVQSLRLSRVKQKD